MNKEKLELISVIAGYIGKLGLCVFAIVMFIQAEFNTGLLALIALGVLDKE